MKTFKFNERVIWDSNFGYDVGYFLGEGVMEWTYLIDMKSGLIHMPCSQPKDEIHPYSNKLVEELTKKYGYRKTLSL